MEITTTTFIIQLPQEIQDTIYDTVKIELLDIVDGPSELEETLENVMCGRICDLQELRCYDDIEVACGLLKEDQYRTCSICGHAMTEGYCYDGGTSYYCDEDCLHHDFTDEEWEEAYDDGNSDSYWTTWH